MTSDLILLRTILKAPMAFSPGECGSFNWTCSAEATGVRCEKLRNLVGVKKFSRTHILACMIAYGTRVLGTESNKAEVGQSQGSGRNDRVPYDRCPLCDIHSIYSIRIASIKSTECHSSTVPLLNEFTRATDPAIPRGRRSVGALGHINGEAKYKYYCSADLLIT